MLRVLCREDFSKRGAHDFLDDLERTMQWYQIQDPGQVPPSPLPHSSSVRPADCRCRIVHSYIYKLRIC